MKTNVSNCHFYDDHILSKNGGWGNQYLLVVQAGYNVTEAEGAQSNIFDPVGIAALKFHTKSHVCQGIQECLVRKDRLIYWCCRIFGACHVSWSRSQIVETDEIHSNQFC